MKMMENAYLKSRYCWFIHENHESESINEGIKEGSGVLQKVFGMLEIMSERIMKIDKYNKEKMETT